MNAPAPLTFTSSPRLDAALVRGFAAWLDAGRHSGADETVRWMAGRADLSEQVVDVEQIVGSLLAATDADEIAAQASELAETISGDDDALAEVLVEGVLAHGIAVGDVDYIVDAVEHLAELAERAGDALTAAEYHIEFLTWRRRADHGSDPESVLTAFDEIIRLAELDGAPEAAATYSFRQVTYQSLADADADAAYMGDWDLSAGPFTSWS